MILALIICLLVVLAFILLMTLPRWFARSLGQDRIWRLRDELVADIVLNEALPKDHIVVQQLLRRMDWAVREGKHFTLLNVYVTARISPRMDRLEDEELYNDTTQWSLEGLGRRERELLLRYRHTFESLFVGSLLLGSWLGLAKVARELPAVVAAQWRLRRGAPSHGRLLQKLEFAMRESAPRAADSAATARKPFGNRLTVAVRRVMGSWFISPRSQKATSRA